MYVPGVDELAVTTPVAASMDNPAGALVKAPNAAPDAKAGVTVVVLPAQSDVTGYVKPLCAGAESVTVVVAEAGHVPPTV